MLPWLERQFLYGLTFCILVASLCFAKAHFLRALPRVRWLLITVGVVYAWSTPGEYYWSGWMSPTYEGVRLAFFQVLRLFIVIASLQILLANLSRSDLFSALYIFAKPLKYIGLSREILALRMTLTLERVEVLLEKKQNIASMLSILYLPKDGALNSQYVQLSICVLSAWQLSLLLIQLFIILLTTLGGSAGFF